MSEAPTIGTREIPTSYHHADERKKQVGACPHLYCDIVRVHSDKMSSNDGTEESWDSSEAVHHASPVTELLFGEGCILTSVGTVQNVPYRSRGEPNNHARKDSKDHAEGDSVRLRSS